MKILEKILGTITKIGTFFESIPDYILLAKIKRARRKNEKKQRLKEDKNNQ